MSTSTSTNFPSARIRRVSRCARPCSNASRTIAWPSSAYSDDLITSESIVRPIASCAE